MFKLIWSGLFTLLLLSGCGWNGTPTRHNDFVPLTSIEIISVPPAIAAKTSTKLSVIGHYSGLFTRDITDQAIWKSDNSAIAGFSSPSNPRVTGGSAPGGIAVITATVGTVSATYSLTVKPTTIKTMTISPANPSVASGFTTQFSAIGTFQDDSTQDLTFDSTWTATLISTPIAANVSDDPANKGLAKGLAEGTATITASFDGTPGSTQLKVDAPILQSIAVTPVIPANSSVVGFQKTVNFIATGTFSDGTTNDVTSTATWASSQTSVATITAGGVATTVAVGSTSLSATVGGISGKTDLTVTAPVLKTDGLQISPANTTLTLSSGTTQQLTLTATYTDNSTQIVTSISSWTITPSSSIATVNTTGLVTASSVGTVTVQATYLGQSVSTNVTITQ